MRERILELTLHQRRFLRIVDSRAAGQGSRARLRTAQIRAPYHSARSLALVNREMCTSIIRHYALGDTTERPLPWLQEVRYDHDNNILLIENGGTLWAFRRFSWFN